MIVDDLHTFAVAVLVLFTGTAGAWVVTSDLRSVVDYRLRLLLLTLGRRSCLALCVGSWILFFGGAVVAVVVGALRHGLPHFRLRLGSRILFLGTQLRIRGSLSRLLGLLLRLLLCLLYMWRNEYLAAHECRQRFGIKRVHCAFKQVERLYLIDYKRIFLFV